MTLGDELLDLGKRCLLALKTQKAGPSMFRGEPASVSSVV
jgi:hypothetical protein